MFKTTLLILTAGVAVAVTAAPAQTFTPGERWPDDQGTHINAHGGGILYSDSTYYWFGEHKTEGKAGNVANVGVHVYSSKNLYNWKDEGIALKVSDDPKSEIVKGCILERPKVIYNRKNNNYIMWFHLELKGQGYGSARSGIAVSDKITGPYTYLKSVRPNPNVWPIDTPPRDQVMQDSRKDLPAPKGYKFLVRDFEKGQMARDMTLFVDDDQRAYHIYSSEENSTLQIAELNEDYTGYTGKYARFFAGRHMEAPAMFKKNGQYYLIMSGCSGWAPNAARSAVSNSIWGDWKELDNPAIGKESNLTFRSQSTHILPVEGKNNCFIYMGDRWTPEDAIDGRYIWLPIEFNGEKPIMHWQDSWPLDFWKTPAANLPAQTK